MSSIAPIKILHVVYTLEPGGMENGITNIARALDPERFDIHVCCLERRGAFADRLPAPDQVYVLGKQPGFSLGTCFSLRREILRLRPNLIHSHNLGPLIYGAIASFAGSLSPILQGEHAELTAEELTPRRLRQRRWLYRSCDAIHSVSSELHRQLLELGFPRKKLRAILNGVDTSRFAPGDRTEARQRLGLPDSAFILGIVGRFGPLKRHRLLIEAFEEIADRNPDIHLLIIGGGGPEERPTQERQQASRHAKRIILTGFQNDLRLYYQALDALVAPSINEGLSNAVLEGMASGIPVLAHGACGNGEVVTEGVDGFLADLSSAPLLGKAILRLEKSAADLPAMGRSARIKVTEHFSLEKMAQAYELLYQELARTR